MGTGDGADSTGVGLMTIHLCNVCSGYSGECMVHF